MRILNQRKTEIVSSIIRLSGAICCVAGVFCNISPIASATVASSKNASSSDTPAVQGTLEQTSITGVDPKTGKLLWKANAKSVDAHTGLSGGAIGDMHDAVATLYQHGLPEAIMSAPLVSGDLGTKIVRASGGVVVHTLGHGPKTTVRCDSVIWHSDTNIMLGYGHVVITGPGYTQTGPSFQADTKMQSVMIPAPGSAGGVHATIDARKWNAGK